MPESLIGKTIENYRIDRLLGQGGMAAVYEVFDLKLKRRVAMKIMHEHLASQNAFRDMFVREGQNAARLDHPFIVKVYGFNITGEYLYIVMELIEGGNLRRYVKRLAEIGQFIDYAEAAEIVRQLSSAIHYAHDRGMVHRDLKPDNVMLKPRKDKGPGLNYRPIITDFGLARLTTAGDEQATATQPIGTYPYMSPEQVNAEPVDRRTDIYALGIILFELSVGRLPYNPKSIAEAARMHGREPVPKPSEFYRDFPKPLEDIIMKCLEKDVERRYQTAEEIVRDLTVFINQGPRAQSKLPNLVEERPQQSTSSVMAPPARRQDRQPQQPPAEQQPPAQPREQQAQQQPPVQSPPVQPQAPQPPAPQQGQRPPLQPRPRQGQQSVPERQQDEQSPAQPGQGQQQPSQAGQQPPAQQQGQQPPPQTYPQPVQLPADDEPQVDTDYGDGDESEQGRRRGLFGRLFGGRDDRDDDRNSRDEDETDRRDERQPSAPQQQVIQPVVVPPVPQQPQSAPPQQPPEDQYAPDESAIANIQQNIEPPQVNEPPAQQTADRYTTQEASILDSDDMPADTGQGNDSRSAAPPMQVDDNSRPVARSPQQPSSGQPYDAEYAQPPVEESYAIGEDAPTPPPDVDESTYGSAPTQQQPYDAGDSYTFNENAPTPPPDVDESTYGGAPAQQQPYDAGDSYTFNENAPTPPPDIDESTYGAPAQQPYDAGDSYTFNENAPTPPPDYGDEEPRYSVYSTQEASILDADTLSTPVPGSGPAYGSPEEYRQYRQAAIEQEEEYITEIETSVMPQQIATNLPMSVPSVERTAYQRDIDCLAIYSHDHSYIVELPTSQAEFQIGREPKDDIFLEGDLISRDHAVLERKPNGFYYLIDGDSTNGTYIGTDQLPANKPIILREGTTIRMGNYWMQLLPRMSGGAAPGIAQPYDDDYSTDAGFDPVAEGPPTQLMGFIPVADMPKVEPPRLTGEQLMTDRLVIYHKGRAPQIVLLKDAQYVIGRSEDNDIVLPDQNVSRRHAVIDRSDDFYYIRDLNTLNGTWFEQERIEPNEQHRMNASRVVRIGDNWITFEAGRAISGTMRSTGGGIQSDALAARGLSSAIAARDDTYDDSLDTVAMVRPLETDIPSFSMPPLSDEMRASDRLIFISEDHPIQIEKLDKEVLTIGRGSNQDIRLRGRRISREHMVLELRADGSLYLTDTDSRNGTWVGNTLAVPQTTVEWKRHETLRIANFWVRFERGSGLLDPFMAARMDPRKLTGRTIGTYRIDRYIGETELSSVYKATDIQLERDVALRIMHPERYADPTLRQQFLEEAQVISRLEHPNIVRVMSYQNISDDLFMVMELISGGTLRSVLQRLSDQGNLMELDDAIDLTVQLANGLHYAHQQGLIHRDIKPDNINMKVTSVVGPIVKYTPVLTDFTIARDSNIEELVASDDAIKQYPYLSPEAARGDRVDMRSDIYELGTTFYEMLSGRPPFTPRSVTEAVRMHTREPIVMPSNFRADVPQEIEAVIRRALAKNPDDRYQTAVDMARALQRAAAMASQGGAALEGDFITGTFLSSVVSEDNATVVMERELPKEMPLLTDPPQPEGEILYDRLAFYSETSPTTVVDVTSPVVTVGRGEDQNVSLPSDKISRRHARIERSTDGTFRIRDMGSTNGTFIGNYELIEDVVEVWEVDETVRLGDYWVRIETREQLEADKLAAQRRAALVAAAQVGGEQDDEYQTDAGVAPKRQKPRHDDIGVTVDMRTVTVQPGTTATMSLEVENRSDFVETYQVEVFGLPTEWVTQSADEIDLLPYNRQTTAVTFHPPMDSTSTAGAHAFEIRVRAVAKQIDAVKVQCQLIIQPYHTFNTELFPERINNRGRVEVTVRNDGNAHSTYNIIARDREQSVDFSIEGGLQYTIAPGRTELVNIRVAPKNRPLFGQPRFLPYEVIITPVQEVAGGPQTRNAELTVTSRFAIWMFVLPLVLLLLCGIISGIIFGLNRRSTFIANATATPAAATRVVFGLTETALAVADADDDGDRLTNVREQELGTEIDNPDTDGDGLTDGEEVLSYATDPLNVDTDGDNCSDGREVNELLTNPTVADTDGDEIGDCFDANPSQLATPTATPFPIAEGGTCPGSPASRLTAGTRALITTDPDLSNRIRSAPDTEAGDILGFAPPGADIILLEGPVCGETDFLSWWFIDYQGLQGWSAEGEADVYYMEPAGGTTETSSSGTNNSTIVDARPPSRAVVDSGRENYIAAASVQGELPPDGVLRLDRSQMGLQIFTNITEGEWQRVMVNAAPLSMGWVKVQANWRYLEPDFAGHSPPQRAEFYSHIRTAKANGYNVIVSVAKAPDWARSTTVEAGPPDDPQALANFIQQMLDEAGGSIDAIEVWNEPNLIREWTSPLDMTGSNYMALFEPSYRTIRAYSPDIVVITAGLAPAASTGVSADDREYLRQMYREGLANYSNVAIGVHPYGWGNPPDAVCCGSPSRGWDQQPQFFFLHTLVDYRNIMLRYGDGDADLWVTEFGWTTWNDLNNPPPETWMGFITPAQQGDYAIRAFEIGQSLDYVGPMMLWNFNFANADTIRANNEVAGFSITVETDASLRARPIYDALKLE